MVSWKSKYLEMKLKYINSKNKLKGGMDKRMKNFNNLPFDIKQQISYDATIKYANEEKKKVLDTITEDYSYLFTVDYTLKDLMINEGIEWKNIEDIKNESIENINNNLWSNDISIRNSIELVNDDY